VPVNNFRNAKLQKQKTEIYNITEFLARLYQEKTSAKKEAA
jgi:hypothetical protein